MASLNTLRTRGGVIVTIVIALALIAFLMGDLLSSGGSIMNSRKMRVGEIAGKTVGYVDFNNLVQHLTVVSQTLSGRDALSAEEQEAVQGMAWESLIMRNSYVPSFENLGLIPGDAEQKDMVSGVYLSSVITNTFVGRNGAYDPAQLKGFIENMHSDMSGRSVAVWEYLKEQMIDQRAIIKFMMLVSKGMYSTDYEVQQSADAANTSYAARYVAQSYSLIPDSTVKITDAEIKAYYNNHRAQFKQGSSRGIEYVVFDMVPSQDDYDKAGKHIAEIAAEFETSPAPMQYATLNSQNAPNTAFVRESDLIPAMAEAVVPAKGESKMYGPVLNGDTYTIARLVERKNLPDTLGAKHILVADDKLADSLISVLKGGGNFAELSSQYSLDENAQARGGDLGQFAYERMIPEFSEACAKATKGDIFKVKTQYGVHVVELTYKSKLQPKVQLATITYHVEPSEITAHDIYSKASTFLSKGAGSYANFNNAIGEESLSKRNAMIRNTDRNVSGLDNSRELIRWAFNAAKGDVSHIMEINGDYVVAALTELNEAGTAPLNQASVAIRSILMREKKGDILASRMAGVSSLDDAASKLDAEIGAVSDLQFASFYIDGIGVEQKLIGAITSTKSENVLSKPVKGFSGVYLYDVTGITPLSNATIESERVRAEAMAQSYLSERINNALQEVSGITDNRAKFF